MGEPRQHVKRECAGRMHDEHDLAEHPGVADGADHGAQVGEHDRGVGAGAGSDRRHAGEQAGRSHVVVGGRSIEHDAIERTRRTLLLQPPKRSEAGKVLETERFSSARLSEARAVVTRSIAASATMKVVATTYRFPAFPSVSERVARGVAPRF